MTTALTKADGRHAPAGGDVLLAVRDLCVEFATEGGVVPAVDHVSFELRRGTTLGLVGESGCGKSVTCLSIMRLLGSNGRIVSGSVEFDGEELLTRSEVEMAAIRGVRISMIFQEPMTSLNPVYTIGEQIMDVVMRHQGVGRREARARAIEQLKLVGIPIPERRVDAYPHELSGGMRQRAMIAMALSCHPEVLIADEPTTALDVTIQAQILDLMRDLRDRLGTSLLLITHDLGVIAEMADEVAVMYAGQIVERADVVSLFRDPKHPYTRGLLASVPRLGVRRDRLETIEGTVPHMANLPPGCRFAARCHHVMPRCLEEPPPLNPVGPSRTVRCWLYP